MDSQSKPRRNVINYREFGRKTTGNQGDVGSNPAQGIKSFSSNENVIQRVVRPWSLLNSLSLSIYIYIYIYREFRSDLDLEVTKDGQPSE